MKRNRRQRTSGDISANAGWLLAELFLVLAVVWLGSQIYQPPEPKHVSKHFVGIDPIPLVSQFRVETVPTTITPQLKKEILSSAVGRAILKKRTVGIVFISAGGDNCNANTNYIIGQGIQRGQHFFSLLSKSFGGTFAPKTPTHFVSETACSESGIVHITAYLLR
jgi:hypothetical protein